MTDQFDVNDDDISTARPTDDREDLDGPGEGPLDTGDEPAEDTDDLDAGGEGERDTGDR